MSPEDCFDGSQRQIVPLCRKVIPLVTWFCSHHVALPSTAGKDQSPEVLPLAVLLIDGSAPVVSWIQPCLYRCLH